MITVTILINGQPVITRSAVRREKGNRKGKISHYMVDTGAIIEHAYDDGAVALAKKMLDTVVERG
jgi:hypothetical protein